MAEIKYQKLVNSLLVEVENLLKPYNLSLADAKKIATAVQYTSDFYIKQPEASTPWHIKEVQIANIAYYYPLNTLRCFDVIKKNLQGFKDLDSKSIVDLGSGLGAFSRAFSCFFKDISVTNIEDSIEAINLHKKIASINNIKWQQELNDSLKDSDLLTMSYSYTENISIPKNASSLFIIEPSTKEDFSRLLELRKSLLQNNWTLIGPCSHSEKCPLEDGRKDWCHFSFAIDLPDSIKKIESFLPWKNQSLSYSYLFASSKKFKDYDYNLRIIGRPRKEKGKSRQLVCRSEKREFLSVLKKDKFHLNLESGDKVKLIDEQKKGNEIRVSSPEQIIKLN